MSAPAERVGWSARVEVLLCRLRECRPSRSHESSPLIEVHRTRTTTSVNMIGMSHSDVVDGARSRHRSAIGWSSQTNHMRGAVHTQIATIGLDIAKNVFQVHGIDVHEKVVVRKQLRRGGDGKMRLGKRVYELQG
jgi:hypothetical protein